MLFNYWLLITRKQINLNTIKNFYTSNTKIINKILLIILFYNWLKFNSFSISNYSLGVHTSYTILFSNPKELYNFNLKNKTWKEIVKFQKHKAIDSFNCSKSKNISIWYKKWWNKAGIYKLTFLNFKLFSYYGSSSNLGQRIKYHYYNGKHQGTF